MSKRLTSVLAGVAMVAGLFSALPAHAEEVKIPDEASIMDPFGDANYANDQANPHTVGDNVTPADASTVADLGKIWFSAGKEDLTVFIQTEKPLGTNAPAYVYDVYASPGSGSVSSSTFYCLRFTALYPGNAQGAAQTTYQGPPSARLTDRCNVGSSIWSNQQDGEIEIITAADTSGIIKMTFQRDFSPLLADGVAITGPYARSANLFGAEGNSVTAPQVDTTIRGTDFIITPSGGGGGDPKPDPGTPPVDPGTDPGKGDEKKNDCGKKKGKAKKKCKKGKGPKDTPKGCAKYVPGEEGAEAETFVVTDKHTAEAPLQVEFDGGIGLGGPIIAGVPPDETTRTYHNVQVDSKAAEAGLYVRLDFNDRRDYDLYLNYPTGDEASHSGDFNGAYGTPVFECGDDTTGCQSGTSFESINGIRTADCGGWTTESVAFLTEGGDVTLSVWLGEITTEPAAPAV